MAFSLVFLASCTQDFDPSSLLSNLRVLAISAEPADLTPGESTVLEALVVEPGDSDIDYAWQWCPFVQGADSGFACLTEELGLPPEALAIFDLGDEPEAVFGYPGDGEMLRDMCEALLVESDRLPSFIGLPDCETGLEVTVRLVVSTEEMTRVAVRDLFLWFESPDESERNHNPVIGQVRTGANELRPGNRTIAVPGQYVGWDVVLDESSLEPFVIELTEGYFEQRREDLIYSFFSTAGEWDRTRSYADLDEFSLAEAGRNVLAIPEDHLPDSAVDVYFVVRDERGGVDWAYRELWVVQPE